MIKLLTFIHIKRKRIAVLFAAAAELAALPFIISGNTGANEIAVAALIASVFIAVILFAKGVPAAVAALTCAFLMAIGVAISVFLNVPQPVVVVIIIILVVFAKFPSRAKYYAKNLLPPEEQDKLSRKKQKPKKDSAYKRYKARKRAIRANSQDISPARVIAGLAIMLAGAIGLLIFAELEDNSPGILGSYVFLAIIASFAVFLGGIFLIAVGFIRALIGTASAIGIITVAFFTGRRLIEIFEQSVLRFFVLLSLIILLVALISIAVTKFFRGRTAARTFTGYDKDGCLMMVDLVIEDLLPVDGYTKLTRCAAVFEPQPSPRFMDELVTKII
ncbi:MAG: hypothetical protein FWE86_04750, partial [Oscillospiraceae bacterium]|nr:hypothetical protein [Oscillospiraceae bacterium]